ncbi:MAG TPA: hypothetical protein V6D43_08370 [Candidatus Sericytochromatia bacterium]
MYRDCIASAPKRTFFVLLCRQGLRLRLNQDFHQAHPESVALCDRVFNLPSV